jgi:hypothetical protein
MDIVYLRDKSRVKLTSQGSEVLGSGLQRFWPRLDCLQQVQAPSMSRGARRRLAAGFSPLPTDITSDLFMLLSSL